MSTANKSTSGVRRIATNLAQEIKYWAEMLGCTEAEVMPAVKDFLGLPASKKAGGIGTTTKRRYRLA